MAQSRELDVMQINRDIKIMRVKTFLETAHRKCVFINLIPPALDGSLKQTFIDANIRP
jgi:hypothetical protein